MNTAKQIEVSFARCLGGAYFPTRYASAITGIITPEGV